MTMTTQGSASAAHTLTMLATACAAASAGAAWGLQHPAWLPVAAGSAALAVGSGLWSLLAHRRQHAQLVELRDALDGAQIDNGRLQRQLKRHGELERQLLQAKQAAESATLAKGEFLATMSHEIRTPLNGILPMLEMISQGRLDPQQREMLQAARASSMQLLRIVDDILDYSKLEANRLELEVTNFNLREVLDSMLQLLQHSAQRKQLQVGMQIDPGVRLAVRGDPVRLRQILSNLIVNAIKFTEHGSVQVKVRRIGETEQHHQIRFEVTDTGIGISQEQQDKLFSSFTQADASTTRLYGGTGLGLAICKRIVDLMAGRIGVESELRKGSTFWFEIPLLKVAGDIYRTTQLPPPSQCLLISPDQRLRHRLEQQLSPRNIALHASDNAPEALERLRALTSSKTQLPLEVVFADLDALGDAAPALHRVVTRTHGPQGVRLVWIQGELRVPDLLLERSEVLPRQFHDADLATLMQAPAAMPVSPSVETELSPASDPLASASQLLTNSVSLIGARILLVEDNPVNQMVAQKLLDVLGCQVTSVGNGEVALQEMASNAYDIVLMDCQMPVLDGYSATRQWREREFATGAARLPIIAMTANAMAGDRQRCLDAGMDDYLSKPVSREELQACLQRWYQGSGVAAATGSTGTTNAPAPAPSAPAPEGTADITRNASLSVLDNEALDELLEIAGAETAQIIQVFLNDAPRTIRELQEAATAPDMVLLRDLSHSLKSASANVGATALSAAARRIEVGARAGTLDHPAVAVALVIAEFSRAKIALMAYQASVPQRLAAAADR